MTLKRFTALLTAILIAVSVMPTAVSAEEAVPELDLDAVFIAQQNMPPQKAEHSGENFRASLLPGSTVYFSIKNAHRAEDISGYRAIFDWSKGEEYVARSRVEYCEVFDSDGKTSLGYRYVVAMGLTETSDDVMRTLRGSVRFADRASRITPEISFTVSVGKGANLGRADSIYCDSPSVKIEFGTLSETVVINFHDFCSFEIETIGQQDIDAGCSTQPLTDISERYRSADLKFIWWYKRPIFDRVGTLRIYPEHNEKYLYELRGGELVDISESFDNAHDAFVIPTRRLEGYVLSDRALSPDALLVPEANPPTGAEA